MHTKLPIISSYKNSSFRLPDFRRNWESLQIKNLMANCLRRRDQMVYSIFQNRAPWGTTFFLFKWFHSERKCLLRWVHYQLQSPILSKSPSFQNLKIFSPIFFCWIYSLFRSINKIHDDKISETQVLSFHAYANIKQCLHISKVCENIHDQKTNKNYPQLIFYLNAPDYYWQVLWI